MSRIRRWLLASLLLAYAGSALADGGSAALRIGSKNFTESIVLAEILRLDGERRGLSIEHRRALGGSAILWQALREGSLDAYPEYTGTLTQELLHAPATPQTLQALGIGMSASLGFEDRYALGVTESLSMQLGLHRLSDLAAHPELRLALSNEFMNRSDGWPLVRDRYGLRPQRLSGIDHSLAYRALSGGAADVIDLYTTDPEIMRDHIVVLDDDLHAFPDYQAVWLYRLAAAQRQPALLAALHDLTGTLSATRMQQLNAAVQLSGLTETAVAEQYLQSLFGAAQHREAPPPALAQRLGQRTLEHLRLVGISLALALLIGLPAGVAAAQWPAVGRVLLPLAVILQTVPSLAMLVFMIPLLGIGARPAIATLFLYSLLPIVRNTATGLASIPSSLQQAAASLGLPWRVRLFRIEAPLAARVIIAGISTAAVINVGTATLGALIGAGGYGEPILTGIRLNSVPQILEGAVPAALLALLVMGLFQALEHLVTPRGLRLRSDG